MEEFKAGIDANYNTYKTVRIIILILFYIIVIGAYLMLWLPLLRKLSKDVNFIPFTSPLILCIYRSGERSAC